MDCEASFVFDGTYHFQYSVKFVGWLFCKLTLERKSTQRDMVFFMLLWSTICALCILGVTATHFRGAQMWWSPYMASNSTHTVRVFLTLDFNDHRLQYFN